MAYKLTKKQILKEIRECGKNPDYFTNNYAKISHPKKGLIPFKTFDFQKDLLEDFNDHRFTIVLKARQLGISTLTAVYICWLLIFFREKNVLIMATKRSTAGNLLKKVKIIYKNLPKWMQSLVELEKDNMWELQFDNGSTVKAVSTSSDAGRSEALSLLVLDEAAHIEGLTDKWTSLYSTLSTGGRCLVISTPNGVGGFFHETYKGADEGKNDFHPVKLMWDVHPERDQEWFEHETRNLSHTQIAQELLCNFNASGDTVISPADIDMIESCTQDPIYETGMDRNYWIWEQPQEGEDYLLVADVARGDGEDYSGFHIFKVSTMVQVAEYKGKITSDIYATIMYGAGREYNDAMIVVENNKGEYALGKLKEMDYPNIYYETKGDHEYVTPSVAEYKSNCHIGFAMSFSSRPIVIAKLEEFVRNKKISFKSKRMYHEVTTFIWHNGRPQAQKGYNDDLVIPAAIACWVRSTVFEHSQRENDYKVAFLKSIVRSTTTIDTTIPGMMKREHAAKQLDEQRQAGGDHTKFNWLYKG